MHELTVIIISKEDSDVISMAIESVKGFAGEILIIDGNNNDSTKKIAEKLGATVIRHPFTDFADQRNFAILHARTAWVLYLDSDERVTKEFKNELEKVIREYDKYSAIGGYFIYRKTFYYGRNWHQKDKVQRLFLRKRFVEWQGVVHETPKIKGEFGLIHSPIEHYTHRNLSQMVRKTNEWSEYEANLRFEGRHPPLAVWRFIRVMGTAFVNSYIKDKGYKNGTYGLIEAIYQSFSIFITYAKLWEMQEKSKKI